MFGDVIFVLLYDRSSECFRQPLNLKSGGHPSTQMSQAARGQEILEGLGEGQKQLWKKNCDIGVIGRKEGYKMTWPCIMKLDVSTAMLIAYLFWMRVFMATSNRAKNQ